MESGSGKVDGRELVQILSTIIKLYSFIVGTVCSLKIIISFTVFRKCEMPLLGVCVNPNTC